MASRIQTLTSRADKLREAVRDGNLQTVKILIADCDAHKLFITYKKQFSSSIICSVVRAWGTVIRGYHIELEKQAILEELVKAGADINDPDNSMFGSHTPLTLAIFFENLRLSKLLVNLGAEISIPQTINQKCDPAFDMYRRTPLKQAIRVGPVFVAFLLEHNAQLTECDDKMCHGSALYNAVLYHKPGVLEMLMDWYEKSKRCFPWKKCILTVMKHRDEDDIIAILHKGYHLNASTDLLSFYFHFAASECFTKMMRLLLEQQPQILQADWMLNDNLPRALQTEQHKDFVAWLKDIRSQPLTLQLTCRLTILRQLRPIRDQKIDELPLPKKMKDFLKLKEGLMPSP